ncbi:uncharacterized protein [Halyomorpha halys]|uniref:uncharacterized protein n=1 Tax=Halyomorpha halys TaxID=286706 RepID=UPI0006D4DB3D|nr:uncharacterized protein LOC106682668 [Halyomorpha halys]
MKFYYCLTISLLGIVHGSPYYYREDKHHSEHHKEYSYGNSQPSLSAYESSPQKYVETSHFSTHAAPERYYKLETNPTFSSGFSQYSGGGQSAFHQSEFQRSGIQSAHISPLVTGQSINVEGIKPGTYVIKQVKVYRQPTTYTGFYGTSHLDGKNLETGQQEENFYGSQHEENLKAQTGQYVKQVQTSLYHPIPRALPTITQDESLFGQKQISEEDFSQFGQHHISGQKEDCTYNEHIEDFGQQPLRGDLNIGQEQEDLSTHHSQVVKTLENTPINDKNKGYKYYEKRVTTYGLPEKESNAYKQTYVHHSQMHGTADIGGKDFGKFQDFLLGKTTIKPTNGFENVPTGSRQESKHVRYSQEEVQLEKHVQPIKPQTHYNNPTFIPHAPGGQQIYSGSLEEGQHEESQFGQHSPDLGQQLVSGSLEVGQQPDSITGQQLETGFFELGKNQESLNGKHVHTWERHVNTSTVEVNGSRREPAQKPFEHHLKTEHLEFGKSSNNKPHILVKENVTRTVIVGHNIPKKPLQNVPEGQKEETADFLEVGQKEENIGQLETGFFDLGQKEENVGQLETGNLGIGQREENVGQLETGDLGIGQQEEKEEILNNEKFNLGQKEETSFDFELSKSTFPAKLIETTTKAPKYNDHSSYVKTYNQHESHYKEFKQASNSNFKDFPVYYQKYDTTTPRNGQENINTNKKTDYLKLQQKAEELALQLGLEDISKQKSSQQESYEDKFVNENMGKTSTSEVHATEIKEHSIANHHALETESFTPNKKITWETRKEEYGLNYPLNPQGSYSKKQTKHHYENQGYINQPMLQNYGYQGQSQHSQYGGYGRSYSASGERAYFSDQPIQKAHTSGSQFSFFSSSGGSQGKEKVIDDFLKELDKDIAITNHQQRQQQGSYAGITQSRPVNSDVSYYSQRTVSTHSNSSYSSSGTVPGGTTGKTWYQRIGDSIGTGYNQAKDKAKDIVKTVKQSVGYSSS